MFKDREDAGRKLAEALKGRSIPADAVVVALPRGGVVPGHLVAEALGLPLDIVVPRKIGAPWDPEYAIGAVAEGGEPIWNETEAAALDPDDLKDRVAAERVEADRRLRTYRPGLPPRDLADKTVIVVDDGIATGLTMRAALTTVRKEKAARIVVAVPVAPHGASASLKDLADETVVLSEPLLFGAIGASYHDFPQVDDETVTRLMRRP